MAKQLKITLVKSVIGYEKKQKETAKSLGLTKMHKSVIHNDTPDIRGKARKIAHLVKVEEIEG